MSEKYGHYGETSQVRWSTIHSKECMGAFDYFYSLVSRETQKHLTKTLTISTEDLIKNIGELLYLDTQGIIELSNLLDTPEKKTEFLQKAAIAINHSYGLFHTMASSADNSSKVGREYVVYDFQSWQIPSEILKSLQKRVHDSAFQFLGTTRDEHYKEVMKSIKKKGKTIKLGQYETVLCVVDDAVMLQSPIYSGKILGIKSIFGDKSEKILARIPYERAIPIKVS